MDSVMTDSKEADAAEDDGGLGTKERVSGNVIVELNKKKKERNERRGIRLEQPGWITESLRG
jgi:hypothetical protein